MVVSDGRQTGFCDQLRQRETQGNLHGNCQAVFGDYQIDIELLHKAVELVFDPLFHQIDCIRLFPCTDPLPEYFSV